MIEVNMSLQTLKTYEKESWNVNFEGLVEDILKITDNSELKKRRIQAQKALGMHLNDESWIIK